MKRRLGYVTGYVTGAAMLVAVPLGGAAAGDLQAGGLAVDDAAPSAERIEADVRFLADDALEGREAGKPGYALAAGYVAGQFVAAGLEPSANGTYFQQVPLISYRDTGPEENRLSIAGVAGFEPNADYFVSGTSRMDKGVVEAPLAFVGYGFQADGYGWDDFGEIDLEGKIAVILRGAPPTLNTEERAHFRSTVGERLSQRGAIGILGLWTPETERQFAWTHAQKILASGEASMNWLEPDGKPHTNAPNLKASVVLGPEISEKLFARQELSWKELVRKEKAGEGPLPSFDMGRTARIEFANASETVTSRNVIGVLPGSDPALADEVVVVTAHLDHIGVHPTDEEGDDGLHNGAMDNATGTAAITEVARILAQNPPRRTVMFIALTAEEKGLRGSDYFARYPVLAEGQRLVANVNLDMPVATYDFTDIVAFGAERSTLSPVIEAAATANGVALTPDPQPEQGFFTRSDQYSFVKQGVPSVYLQIGFGNGGGEKQGDFLANHYHDPSDEADLVDYDQLARFTEINLAIVRGVADMDEAPKWKAGDFFGTIFGGPMEE